MASALHPRAGRQDSSSAPEPLPRSQRPGNPGKRRGGRTLNPLLNLQKKKKKRKRQEGRGAGRETGRCLRLWEERWGGSSIPPPPPPLRGPPSLGLSRGAGGAKGASGSGCWQRCWRCGRCYDGTSSPGLTCWQTPLLREGARLPSPPPACRGPLLPPRTPLTWQEPGVSGL